MACGRKSKLQQKARAQLIFTSSASDGGTISHTKSENFARIEVDALGNSVLRILRHEHSCDCIDARATDNAYATLMVFAKPFISEPRTSSWSPVLVITVTDNVRGPKRKLYAPTGLSYNNNRNEGATSKHQPSINTGHQSSDSCIAPVMRPRTRLPLPFIRCSRLQ